MWSWIGIAVNSIVLLLTFFDDPKWSIISIPLIGIIFYCNGRSAQTAALGIKSIEFTGVNVNTK